MEKDDLMDKIIELQDLVNGKLNWADECEDAPVSAPPAVPVTPEVVPVTPAATPVSAPEAVPVQAHYPRRSKRVVNIVGGPTVMGYVLGKDKMHITGIREQVIKELIEAGFAPIENKMKKKRDYGIFIKKNDLDMTITLWCYYELGLERMEAMFLNLMREGQEKVRSGELRPRRQREYHHTSTYSSHPDICRYRELRARRAMRNPDVSKNPQHYTYTINGGYRRKHHHRRDLHDAAGIYRGIM